MAPEGWRKVKLSDLIESVATGVSVNGDDTPAVHGEYGVLKVSAVSSGRFEARHNKRILPRDLHRARLNPASGAIIVSRANTPELVGASAYVEHEHPNLFLPDKLWQLKGRPQLVSNRWLSLFLSAAPIRRTISDLATGTSSGMKNISQAAFFSIPVELPPLEEQHAIESVLITWNRAIEVVDQLFAAKKQRKSGLMQELLTGTTRLESRFGEWQEQTLGELFTERRETGAVHLPLGSITRDAGVIPRDEVERKDTSNADKSKYLRVCPGDIAYNTMRMWQGVSGLSAIEVIVSPAYTVCVPGPQAFAPYFAQLFKYRPLIQTFERHSQGLVSDTWNLKFSAFAKIPVLVPPIEEQRRIAAVLDAADAELAALEEYRDLLKQQMQGLLADLLTGKRRVTLRKVEPV